MFYLEDDDSEGERVSSASAIAKRSLQLRVTVAVNLFKRYLLGSAHLPGEHQTELIAKLPCHLLFEVIEPRTWRAWFGDAPPIPKRLKLRALDAFSQEHLRVVSTRDGLERRLSPYFFYELVYGGLVAVMAKAASAKRTKEAVAAAAINYKPLSAWHLHMDAIEVSALATGVGDLSWVEVKRIAAKRLLELLDRLWSPRHGLIYQLFASDLRLRWTSSSDSEQQQIRAEYDRFPVSYFRSQMDDVPYPNWVDIGIDDDLADVHIYKALLAMVGAREFLKAERLHAWSMDLASAALAMNGLAWADRFRAFGPRLTGEQICWWTLSPMFFESGVFEWTHQNINATLKYLRLPDTEDVRQMIDAGRASYRDELSSLGINVESVVRVAKHATDMHPLVSRG